eukprot:1293196-Heterocapsa_arctica.AAC.1
MAWVCQGRYKQSQLASEKAAKSRPNYKGVEKGVDEFTTRKLYNFLAQKQPMHAGASHTIITDGVWYPQRAATRAKHNDGTRALCKCESAGLQHIWWECMGCNSVSNLGRLQLKAIRTQMNAEPQCLWTTG